MTQFQVLGYQSAGMEENTDWKKVIEYLYEGERGRILGTHDPTHFVLPDDPIFEEEQFSQRDIDSMVEYLLDVGLLETIESNYMGGSYSNLLRPHDYRLSSMGFEVAMQIQEQKREDNRIRSQNRVNSAIGFLTLGLLFATFADTTLTIYLNSGVPSWGIDVLLYGEAAVIIALIILLHRNGMLNPDSKTSD